MKNFLFTAVLFLFSISAFSQDVDCDDPNKIACCRAANSAIIAITPLAELRCKEQKAELYKIFPQIPIYKGFLFNQINKCDLSTSKALLEFEYCIAKTRLHMTVTITDFTDPFFKTDAGQAQMNLYKVMFDAGTTPILRTFPSSNKKFDQSFIAIPEKENYVSFEGLYKNRFFVHIVIDGNRFKLATEVDAFLADYVKAFNF